MLNKTYWQATVQVEEAFGLLNFSITDVKHQKSLVAEKLSKLYQSRNIRLSL